MNNIYVGENISGCFNSGLNYKHINIDTKRKSNISEMIYRYNCGTGTDIVLSYGWFSYYIFYSIKPTTNQRVVLIDPIFHEGDKLITPNSKYSDMSILYYNRQIVDILITNDDNNPTIKFLKKLKYNIIRVDDVLSYMKKVEKKVVKLSKIKPIWEY